MARDVCPRENDRRSRRSPVDRSCHPQQLVPSCSDWLRRRFTAWVETAGRALLTGRVSNATRLMSIKCSGETLSDVTLPPHDPQPKRHRWRQRSRESNRTMRRRSIHGDTRSRHLRAKLHCRFARARVNSGGVAHAAVSKHFLLRSAHAVKPSTT